MTYPSSPQKLPTLLPIYDKKLLLHERMKTLAAWNAFKEKRRIRRELYHKAGKNPNPYNAHMRVMKRGCRC
jgi:hypothetical protein